MIDRDYIRAVSGVPGDAGSVWLAAEAPTYPALTRDARVDVAVVGGGLVGALTAFYLAQSGAKVALIERRRMAGGVTGHSTAKLTAQHSLEWHRLLSMHTIDDLKAYATANLAAVAEVERLATELVIDCSFAKMPSRVYAMSDEDVCLIEPEAEAYENLGLPGGFENAPGLPFSARSSMLEMPDQAVFDPAAFVGGCVRALGPDALVAEATPVRGIEEADVDVRLHCDHATITASAVIMASNVPVYDTAGFFSRVYPYRSYAYLVRTDHEIPAASWLPARHASGVTLRPRSGDDLTEWVVSGVNHKAGQGGDERGCYGELAGKTRELLDDATFLYHWSTQDGSTSDGLPFVGRAPFTRHIYMATGFAGWGMTKSLVSARLLADLVGGGTPELASLLDPSRADPLKGLGSFLGENLDAAGHLIGGLWPRHEDAGTGTGAADAGAEPPEERTQEFTVRMEGTKRSTRWTKGGKTAVHDAHCTHLGCVVEVNEAELTWDCPCHGSRFAADASVVHGPAREDLKPVEGER